MILVKVFVRQLFRIRNSVQIIFTVWTECTFIGEIEETMSLSLFLQGVSLSVFISVNIVNGPFGICVNKFRQRASIRYHQVGFRYRGI